MDTPSYIFELLLKNNKFMDKLDEYLASIMYNNNIDISKIPEIILFLVTALKYVIEKKLTHNETEQLLTIYVNYIMNINIYISHDEEKEHSKICMDMFNACIKLSLTNIKLKKERKYC